MLSVYRYTCIERLEAAVVEASETFVPLQSEEVKTIVKLGTLSELSLYNACPCRIIGSISRMLLQYFSTLLGAGKYVDASTNPRLSYRKIEGEYGRTLYTSRLPP